MAAAVIQPAVPPPTMTTCLTGDAVIGPIEGACPRPSESIRTWRRSARASCSGIRGDQDDGPVVGIAKRHVGESRVRLAGLDAACARAHEPAGVSDHVVFVV